MNVDEFGSAEFPVHPSGMRTLINCAWNAASASHERGPGGKAGDTGSATHVAVSEFHRGRSVSACVATMTAQAGRDYPQADLRDAITMFAHYSVDPRNRVELALVEHTFKFTIDPLPSDPTGELIHVMGTLDQVRIENGEPYLWDVKTSKLEGSELLAKHTIQAAAYCVGATIVMGRPVRPGGLILTRKYKNGASGVDPVFWKFTWTLKDVEQILLPVRHMVAHVRAGELWHVPGADCYWCHHKSPDMCLPKLQEYLRVRKDVRRRSPGNDRVGPAA